MPGRHLAIELAETLKLGVPIALTQLGQIAMMTTDLAMIGRLGAEAVAAAALAHTVLFVSFTFGMGLVSAVAPLAAQAFGARNPHLIRRSLRVGLWAALMVSLPLMALRFWAEQILLMLGQTPTTAYLAQEYLAGLVWTILPALWFMAIRGFMSAINRPEPMLWITLAAIPANALLVYILLFGAFGLPPARPVRRGAGDLHRQSRHVPGCRMVCHVSPAVPEVSRVRPFLAHRLAADVAADRHRRADLALLPA